MDLNKLEDNFVDAFENFDFEKVKYVMKKIDWTWAGSEKSPKIKEMVKVVTELFENTLENMTEYGGVFSCSTGGFKVTSDGDTNEVTIEFILEESRMGGE